MVKGVTALLVGVAFPAELGVEVEMDASVILSLALSEDLVSLKIVERGQDVLQAKDRAEEGDERLLRQLSDDQRSKRIHDEQFCDLLGVFAVVVPIRPEEDDAACVLVAEERNSTVRLFFEVTETDDVDRPRASATALNKVDPELMGDR